MLKVINKLIIIVLTLFFVFAILYRDKINCAINKFQLQHSKVKISKPDSLFFRQQLLINPNTKLHVLEFGAATCKPCRKMNAMLLRLDTMYAHQVDVVFYNVTKTEGKKAAAFFYVRQMPVQVFLDKNGKTLYKHIGLMPENRLLAVTDSLLSKVK